MSKPLWIAAVLGLLPAMAGVWYVTLGLIGQSTQPPLRPQSEARPVRDDAATTFRVRCARCHGDDGTGGPAREKWSDFTSAAWQPRRTDAQLIASILDGKGDQMPAFRRMIDEARAKEMVAHVRAFGSARK